MNEEGMPPIAPAVEDESTEHATRLEGSLSTAFLSVIDSLTFAERTALLVQQVFGYDLTEVASLVGESEADCCRIAGRAKRSVVARRPLFENSSGRKEHPW